MTDDDNHPNINATLQSLQVDRDVTLSEARLTQAALHRAREEEIPRLQQRVQDFERALAECRREGAELERRAAQGEVRVFFS